MRFCGFRFYFILYMTVSTFKRVFGGVSPLSLYICTGLVLDKVRVRFIQKKKKKKKGGESS